MAWEFAAVSADGRDVVDEMLHQEDLPPGTRVRAFGLMTGVVQPWIFADEPFVPWGVYVMFDGDELRCLNIIHVRHLEKIDDTAPRVGVEYIRYIRTFTRDELMRATRPRKSLGL